MRRMSDVDVSVVARLIAEPTRATMLTALLDGRALTAGELARLAGVGAPAASEHLSRMLDGGLLAMAGQGRHRYYRLAGPEVAQLLESLAVLSPPRPTGTLRAGAAARALRPARLCYDHLAGVLSVAVRDRLVAIGGVRLGAEGLELLPAGEAWFTERGVDVAAARTVRRPLLRSCLDWTERRDHLAGALPAAFAAVCLDRGWVQRRAAGERGLIVTAAGRAALGVD